MAVHNFENLKKVVKDTYQPTFSLSLYANVETINGDEDTSRTSISYDIDGSASLNLTGETISIAIASLLESFYAEICEHVADDEIPDIEDVIGDIFTDARKYLRDSLENGEGVEH